MTAEPDSHQADYCCEMMRLDLEHRCDQHDDPFDCPDNLLYRTPDGRKYGLIVHDGGPSFVVINHCPWSGAPAGEGLDPDDVAFGSAHPGARPGRMTHLDGIEFVHEGSPSAEDDVSEAPWLGGSRLGES